MNAVYASETGPPAFHARREAVTDEASYRRTVRTEFDRLESLLIPVGDGQPDAGKHARRIADILRVSGETHGFDAVTRAAALVATAPPSCLPARLLGFIEVLRDVLDGGRGLGRSTGGWLIHAGGPFPEDSGRRLVELGEELSLHAAWAQAASLLGVHQGELARRVGERLGVGVADLSRPSRVAARLVPVSLVEAAPLLPLEDDGGTFVAAAADPTSLSLIGALERITGRQARLEVAPPEALRRAVEELLRSFPASPGGDDAAGVGAPVFGPALVVDGDAATLQKVSGALRTQGFVVEAAASGPEAIEMIRERAGVRLLVLGPAGNSFRPS